ncbi:EAL domain-containing protein [Sphingobium algorifonticola]|uniref:EAL domain-containing protein n=1 Tax=Sphingobium algorifonticola TaxID=2008318 RepID=A0A437JAR6_9SPHN|nr:EAL domain-containing protein [Sphingobium algorifonticola]
MIERWIARVWRENGDDAAARRSLAESLYASPLALVIGGIIALAIGLLIVARTGDPVILRITVAQGLAAVIRFGCAFAADHVTDRPEASRRRAWVMGFEAASWGHGLLIGALASATILRSNDASLHMLAATLAATYGAAAAGRNAGRVQVAIGQSLLMVLPPAVALLVHGGLPYQLLGAVMILMLVGMAEISFKTHQIVADALRGKQEKSQLAMKYERLARFDSLTGVENRMAMQMRLRDLFEKNRRTHNAVAILWMDLDRFKEINDSLGHMVGDHLLCVVAEKLAEALDGRGHVARFGGDEFILICPGADRAAAQAIAADVVDYFRHSFDIAGHSLAVTASIGIAVAPQDGRDVDELMQHADMALYQAKGTGRNRAVSFTWSMKERFNRLHEIETGLRRAIADRELSLHFQPVFNLASGQVVGCEALLRWMHPTLGSVPPQEFIPIAENIGIIAEISDWVLGEACAAATDWPGDLRVAVNISPQLLRSAELPQMVVSHLMRAGLPARRLELEVTENVFLDDQAHTSAMLLELRKIGLRLTLDDFGTGYSSLSYLSAYAFDTIKVDQSFMHNVRRSPESQAVVRAIAFLAAELGMDTVAEGIETDEQQDYASAAGFTDAQGFLLCQPQARPAIAALLAGGIDIGTMRARRARRRAGAGPAAPVAARG